MVIVNDQQPPAKRSRRTAKSQRSSRRTTIQEIAHCNHGARKLEAGRFQEALPFLRHAASSFAASIEDDASFELEIERFGRNTTKGGLTATTNATIFMWSDAATAPSRLHSQENSNSDLHVFLRPAVILPTMHEQCDCGSAALILYNLGLCHLLLALSGSQEHYTIAERCYNACIQLIAHCRFDLRALIIAVYTNLGCILVHSGKVSQATLCFQNVLYEMVVMEIVSDFNKIFGPNDATGIVLNTLYESSTAKAA